MVQGGSEGKISGRDRGNYIERDRGREEGVG
jgi:hypothetical protein